MPFGSIGKSLGGALGGALKGALGSFAGAGAQYGASKLFPAGEPYSEHLRKGVQWRVQDAKKAGVHPLFALGASINNPVPFGQDSFGGAIANSVSAGAAKGFEAPARAAANARAIEAHKAGIEETYARAAAARAQAHRDFTSAQATLSGIARARQRSNVKQDVTKLGGELLHAPGKIPFTTGESSSTQKWEDEYGDLISWIYGAARLGFDTGTNIRRALGIKPKPVPRAWKRSKKATGQRIKRDPMWGLY